MSDTLIVNATGHDLNLQLSFLDALSIPIYVKNIEGLIIYANSMFSELVQMDLDQMINSPDFYLKKNDELGEALHMKMELELLRSKKTVMYEFEFQSNLGRVTPLYITKSLILDANNTPVYIVNSLEIVSYFKSQIQADQRLKAGKQKLIDLSRIVETITFLDLSTSLVQIVIDVLGKKLTGSFIKISDNKELKWVSGLGYDMDSLKNMSLDLKNSLQWIIGKDQLDEVIRIDDMKDIPEMVPQLLFNDLGESIRSLISIPLLVCHELYAYISIESDEVKKFSNLDLEMMIIIKKDIELLLENECIKRQLQVSKSMDLTTSLKVRSALEQLVHEKMKLDANRGVLIQFELLEYDAVIDLLGWDRSELILKKIVDLISSDFPAFSVGFRLIHNKIVFYTALSDLNFSSEITKLVNRIYYNGVQCDKGLIHIPLYPSKCDLDLVANTNIHYSNFFELIYNGNSENYVKSKPMFVES